MIYITGDTHTPIDIHKLKNQFFNPPGATKNNTYLIICGDFGAVWNYKGEDKEEKYWLDWLENKPYTVLFVDGNHECHPRLNAFPVEKTWWEEELPSNEEYEEAFKNLEKNNYEVDYVVTHCMPDNIQYRLVSWYEHDKLTNFLFTVDKDLKFKHWYSGHYHIDKDVDDLHTVLYDEILPLGECVGEEE